MAFDKWFVTYNRRAQAANATSSQAIEVNCIVNRLQIQHPVRRSQSTASGRRQCIITWSTAPGLSSRALLPLALSPVLRRSGLLQYTPVCYFLGTCSLWIIPESFARQIWIPPLHKTLLLLTSLPWVVTESFATYNWILSPVVTPSGWLGSMHQETNKHLDSPAT